MSPVAFGLALGLHGLAIAAVWWTSPFRPPETPQDAILITVEAGAPATSPATPSDDKPAGPAEASTPAPKAIEQSQEEPQQALAEPEPRRPDPPAQQPPPPSPSPPSVNAEAASPESLPPPSANDVPTIRMPLPPWPTPRPSQAEPSPLPRPTQPAPAPPPQTAAANLQAPPSNSSDWLIGKSRARNAYMDQIARLTSRYRRYPRSAADANQHGRLVTRMTIARDGQLIDVKIDTSSGWPAIDAAELEAVRRAAPFPPVPADMPGDPLILIVPINYDLTLPGSR